MPDRSTSPPSPESGQRTLTWLHLSDWHEGKVQQPGGPNINQLRANLIKDISDRAEIDIRLKQIDFVVFSGDLANIGSYKEFTSAFDNLILPILKVTGVPPKNVFIVPGNHDLGWDRLSKIAQLKLRRRLSSLWNNADITKWLSKKTTRRQLLQPFHNYKRASINRLGARARKMDYGYVSTRKFHGVEVVIGGFNSALFCARNREAPGRRVGKRPSDRTEPNDYGELFVGGPQRKQVLDKIPVGEEQGVVRLGILHHPFAWLVHADRSDTRAALLNHFDFILMGHEHDLQVRMERGTKGNCALIHAGACLGDKGDAFNAYNFVHLDIDTKAASVFFRRSFGEAWDRYEDLEHFPGGVYIIENVPRVTLQRRQAGQGDPRLKPTFSRSSSTPDIPSSTNTEGASGPRLSDPLKRRFLEENNENSGNPEAE